MSFYRTYRPQVIGEVDNVAVRELLLSLLTKDKKSLPHAFLFTGPRGAGKTTAARIIAKLFNCTKPTKHGPCGKCEQCTTIAQGRNLDVLEIDAASNRGIDEIRQLRDAINLTPASAAFKVYIIDEVHMLTTEAFNALLKTLEEPPAHAVFVLATTDPQKVPATIKSRCVPVSFHRASPEELQAALSRIVKAEKIFIEKEALMLLAASVDGSFRDAVKLLEQVSFHKGKITESIVQKLTSATDESVTVNFLTSVRNKNISKTIATIERLVDDGTDFKEFVKGCLSKLELLLISEVQKESRDWETIHNTNDLIRRLSWAYEAIRLSPIPQLPLEVAVIEYCTHVSGRIDTRQSTQTQGAESKEQNVQPNEPVVSDSKSLGLLTIEKLTEHWSDFIAELKPYNHSVAGVLRSARPKSVDRGIVTIEAFYQFHKDKLSEPKIKDILVSVLRKLFGEKVKVESVLGEK